MATEQAPLPEPSDGWWARFKAEHPSGFLAVFAVPVGLVIALGGLGGYLDDHDLRARGVETTAVVLSVTHGRDPSSRVEYLLPDRTTHIATTSYANGTANVGDTIDVDYDPADLSLVAEKGARSTAWILWGGWMAAGAAAIASPLIRRGWFAWRRTRR